MNDLKRRVKITHPFHPWSGREFELVEYRRSWGAKACVDCLDDGGRLVTLELHWTDAQDAGDPFVAASAGRAYFRVQDLIDLARLLDGLVS